MKSFQEVTEAVTKKVVGSWVCNKCAREMFLDKDSHYGPDGVLPSRSEDYASMPQHGVSVRVVGGYGNKKLEDLSVRYFDLCEDCLVDFMASFKIPPVRGGYAPIPGCGLPEESECLDAEAFEKAEEEHRKSMAKMEEDLQIRGKKRESKARQKAETGKETDEDATSGDGD